MTDERQNTITKKEDYCWLRPLTKAEKADLLATAQEKKNEARNHELAEENAKSRAKSAKENKDMALRAVIGALDILDTGTTIETVKCDVTLDYDTGKAHYYHPETGQELHARDLTKEERQMRFNFDGRPPRDAAIPFQQ